MKKLWAILLCLLLVGTVALTVFAANDDTVVTVTADKKSVKAGDTVQIHISVTGTDPFTSMGYLPVSDSPCFTIGKHTFGAALEEEGYPSIKNFTKKSGLVVGGFTDYDTEEDIAVTMNGVILSFPITIPEDAPLGEFNVTSAVNFKNGSTNLTFELIDAVLNVYCEHTYGAWAEDGDSHKRICSKCFEEDTAPHAWNAGEVTSEPGCKAPGEKLYTCTDCSATSTEEIPATGNHVFTNPTKVDNNNHVLTCVCGDESVEAHAMDNGTVTKPASCKEPGEKTFACVCSHTTTEPLPKTEDHNYETWTDIGEEHKSTCSICLQDGTAPHNYTNGQCIDCGRKIPYVVIFKDEDGTELSKATYYYGDAVSEPAAPSKAADKIYTYTFAGWDKEIVAVEGDATYTATYTATYIDYTVTFVNEDGSELSKKTYHYGDAVAEPADPAKAADKVYYYTFAGWDKPVAAVEGDATYTAIYTAAYVEYTVIFADDNGASLFQKTYHYGDTVVIPADPSKDADQVYTYTFAGWDKEVVAVDGAAIYTATYTATYIDYTVTFVDEDGKELSKSTYHFGDTVAEPAAPSKAADQVYTYTFAGWDKQVAAVAGDATYTATYEATYIEYTVIFADDNGTELSKKTYHFGDTVVVPADPAKAADKACTYAFAGWDKEIVAVAGDATYTATYTATYIDYTVTFVHEDGTVLATGTYHYGDTVTAPADPTKAEDSIATYNFIGWDKQIVPVEGDTTYTAQFECIFKLPDLDGNGELTDADAVYLLRHTLFPEDYPSKMDMDINCDGEVTDADAVYLLRHTLFPEFYPLYPKKEQQ